MTIDLPSKDLISGLRKLAGEHCLTRSEKKLLNDSADEMERLDTQLSAELKRRQDECND